MESAPRMTRAQARALAAAGNTPSAKSPSMRASKTSARKQTKKDAPAKTPVGKLDFKSKDGQLQSSPNDISGSSPDQYKETPSLMPNSDEPGGWPEAEETSSLAAPPAADAEGLPDSEMADSLTPAKEAESNVLPALSPVVAASPEQDTMQLPSAVEPSTLTKKLAAAVESFEAAVQDLGTPCPEVDRYLEDSMDVDASPKADSPEANLEALLNLSAPSIEQAPEEVVAVVSTDSTELTHTLANQHLEESGQVGQLETMSSPAAATPSDVPTAIRSPQGTGKENVDAAPPANAATSPARRRSSSSATPSFANPTASSKASSRPVSATKGNATASARTPRGTSLTLSKVTMQAVNSPDTGRSPRSTQTAASPIMEQNRPMTRSARKAGSYLQPTSSSAARVASASTPNAKSQTPSKKCDGENVGPEPASESAMPSIKFTRPASSKCVSIQTPPPSASADAVRKTLVATPYPHGEESTLTPTDEETDSPKLSSAGAVDEDRGEVQAVSLIVDDQIPGGAAESTTPTSVSAPTQHECTLPQVIQPLDSSMPDADADTFSFPDPKPDSGDAAAVENVASTPFLSEDAAQLTNGCKLPDGMTPEFLALPKAAPSVPSAKPQRTNDLKYQRASKQLEALAKAEAKAAPRPYNQRLTVPAASAGFMAGTKSSSRRAAAIVPTTIRAKPASAATKPEAVEGLSKAMGKLQVNEPPAAVPVKDKSGQAKTGSAAVRPTTARSQRETATRKCFK